MLQAYGHITKFSVCAFVILLNFWTHPVWHSSFEAVRFCCRKVLPDKCMPVCGTKLHAFIRGMHSTGNAVCDLLWTLGEILRRRNHTGLTTQQGTCFKIKPFSDMHCVVLCSISDREIVQTSEFQFEIMHLKGEKLIKKKRFLRKFVFV